MKIIQNAIVVAAIVGSFTAAFAQTTNIIFQTDFDGDAGMGNGGLGAAGWAGAGSDAGSTGTLPFNAAVTPGVGVGGTSAAENIADFTDLATDPAWQDATSYVWYDLNLDTGFGAPITPIMPTSALSNLVLSADAQVSGLLPTQYGVNVWISKLQFFDGDNNIIFDFNGYGSWVSANGLTHISVPLNTLTYNGNGDALNAVTDFTNTTVLGSIASFNVEFQVNANGGTVGTIGGTGANAIMPVFGFTNSAGLIVDNVSLIQTETTNSITLPPMPTMEQVVWQANFDTTFPNGYEYGFNDRDGSPAATGNWSINPTGGVGGSASLEYTVDLSAWSNNPPVSYSGFGMGANENPLPAPLSSSDVASYRVYLSAKVGGTAAGVSSVPANVDLNFFTPAGQQVMDMTESVTLSNTWQSLVVTNLQVASWLAGAQQLFNQNYSSVNQSELQVSIVGSPNVGTLFGYDTNNTVDVDNIKIVQLVPGMAPLAIVQANGQSEVIWTDPATGGTAQLQSAANVAGPYLDVVGASSATASPYIVPTASKQQFFRTVWVP